MSVRGQHCIDHAVTKQKPLMAPDCLLGVVPQPIGSRLSETMRWQDFSAPQFCLGNQWATDVSVRAALRQIRVETLIGSHAEFEITNKITILFFIR